jgi:trehalose 6-phosphate synthase
MAGRGERRSTVRKRPAGHATAVSRAHSPEADHENTLADAATRLLGDRRLLIATNRGPVTFGIAADGSLRPRRGSGGLVTALSQVGRHVPVTWIAAAMTEGDRRAAADPRLIATASPSEEVRLRFAAIDRQAYEAAYNVIANPLLWFLQHQMWNLPERPVIDASVMRAWQNGYVAVNDAFAQAVLAQAPRSDPSPRIMLHDYHLYLAAEPIRRARPGAVLSHFTHIPWPPSSLWQILAPPMREAICRGLAANDVVGFQTDRYAHNFMRAVESFLPEMELDYSTGRVIRPDGHVAHVRSYPISIDVGSTRRAAASRAAQRRRDQLLGAARERIIVRVDRLEPSKNILRGFAAFEALLARYPRYRGRVTFLAFLVPSRTNLREYGHYGRQVQGAVDRINARYGRAGYRPVQLFYENDYAQAMAGLSIADVILVNPLIDGMNLVAKEAVVVNDRPGVLVLSETAGAFDQMADGVLPVAPADVVGTADAIRTALEMPVEERGQRLARLRANVEREDITWWLARQLDDLTGFVEQRRPVRRRPSRATRAAG